MVKQDEAHRSLFKDYYSNIIVTFWWGVGLSLLSLPMLGLTVIADLLAPFVISGILLAGVWAW